MLSEIQPILLPVRAELAENGRRFQGSIPDARGKPQHVTPALPGDVLVRRSSHHWRQRRPSLRRSEASQAAIREVAKPPRECKARQVEEREHASRHAVRVGVVDQPVERGRIARDPVENEGCLIGSGADHGGMEGAVLEGSTGPSLQTVSMLLCCQPATRTRAESRVCSAVHVGAAAPDQNSPGAAEG